jgi:DNA-directed RNA polymerase specialized sigma24 family protein
MKPPIVQKLVIQPRKIWKDNLGWFDKSGLVSFTWFLHGPDRLLEGEEDDRVLLDLIKEALEPQQQEVLWLRCFERMPVDEITRMLGITASSGARGVLQSARRKLRAALERCRSDERENKP